MKHKRIILAALRTHLGDSHLRARHAFSGLTPAQMREPHGSSGQSRQSILDAHEAHAERVQAAISYIEDQPEE